MTFDVVSLYMTVPLQGKSLLRTFERIDNFLIFELSLIKTIQLYMSSV